MCLWHGNKISVISKACLRNALSKWDYHSTWGTCLLFIVWFSAEWLCRAILRIWLAFLLFFVDHQPTTIASLAFVTRWQVIGKERRRGGGQCQYSWKQVLLWKYRNAVPCLCFRLHPLSYSLTYVSVFIGYQVSVCTCLCGPWEMCTNVCLGMKVISILLFSDFWTSGEGKAWCWKGKTREASGALLRAEDAAGQLSWVHERTVTATTEEGQ